ncbi:MAG: hypothetical protein RL095_3779 [Verrucomicrobiota bacterium]|jgi:hypothetical protein
MKFFPALFAAALLALGSAAAEPSPPAPAAALSTLECQAERDLPHLRQVVAEFAAKYPSYRPETALAAIAEVETLHRTRPGDPALPQKLRQLRRQILLNHPGLPSRDLLFVKHQPCDHRDLTGNPVTGNYYLGDHFCDQYFGFNANTSSSGLIVLSDAFSEHPRQRDLLADAVCVKGRYQGKKLLGGAVISPSLSYDGKTILFAWTEGVKKPGKAAFSRYQWTQETTYHLFKIQVDGSGLTQLTDGAFNDFDPCFLPNGRIAFISERRRGFFQHGLKQPVEFGRCHGRPVPTFTLHAMEADGSGMRCLSWHDTNEFSPVVSHDGRIVYTRWDYVDRGAEQAHHLWTTSPDGCNPRSFHGNYMPRRGDGPIMEIHARPVPGSRKFVATAMAHHGQSYGSLVLIDPAVADDGKMSQVKILTPDAQFPEARSHRLHNWKYGTPWPIDEDWFLCVYDPVGQAETARPLHYSLILLHAPTGLKEVLFDEAGTSPLAPIPLAARTPPPVLPENSAVFSSPVAHPAPATVSILNVHDSRTPLPQGVKIKELRVIQLLPKTTPVADVPKIGYAPESLARQVLGTVPVEADGSVHFTLPSCLPVYFQLLDEQGCAVQSMKSSTYAQPGERVSCVGCHASTSQAPTPTKVGDAFRRPPSVLRPEVEGAAPFSFPRLVQPVLDRHCTECHLKHPGKAPDLRPGEPLKHPQHWSNSYVKLQPYAWSYRYTSHGWTDPVSIPGQIGARASKLWQLLEKGHHGVQLPAEDRRRLSLWLDLNSNFFGTYENTREQAEGKVVKPMLE